MYNTNPLNSSEATSLFSVRAFYARAQVLQEHPYTGTLMILVMHCCRADRIYRLIWQCVWSLMHPLDYFLTHNMTKLN